MQATEPKRGSIGGKESDFDDLGSNKKRWGWRKKTDRIEPGRGGGFTTKGKKKGPPQGLMMS